MFTLYRTIVTVGLLCLAASALAIPPIGSEPPVYDNSRNWDNETYINAGNILMFVTNHGNFGRDLAGVFGLDAGTFYPYVDNESINNGSLNDCLLYAAGLWVGGLVNGEVRLAIAEYSDEYVPGPMESGTYMPDDPAFKVYKLYRDSLADNPNDDYLNWPVDQGAPVDGMGNPVMLGDQMLWTVYNDADPNQHQNDAGETDPLGLEIQQTTWAVQSFFVDSILAPNEVEVIQSGNSVVVVEVLITWNALVSEDTYAVEVFEHPTLGMVWQLRNISTNTILIADRTDFSGNSLVTLPDGFSIRVYGPDPAFASFQVVANGAGPLDPPESGALPSVGFPVPTDVDPDGNPTEGQQVGDGRWLFHTADNGGTSGGGTRGSFDAFVARVTRGGGNLPIIGNYDYEMRFTGDNATPGVGGSYAVEVFLDDNAFWVPFELWNIGIGTPNDPSDDVRLIPFIIDDGDDNTFGLESWGTEANGGADLEHSASGGDNDPFTDWVYWYTPLDMSPGEAGYFEAEADMLDGGWFDFDGVDDEVFARTVLINWNGGDAPPFNQDVPEQGTVFRIVTTKPVIEPDTFTFTPSSAIVYVGISEGDVIYTKYKLYNKGGNVIEDAYISLWADPDLGDYSDDLVGCDTMLDLFFCYNSDNDDAGHYGSQPPAVGFRILDGPVVPGTLWDSAAFDGGYLPGFTNLPMTSFQKYINGTDPTDYMESYNYMRGLSASGSPLPNGTNYAVPGDPVSGLGDLDTDPSDRRMMGTCGPLTLMPGDSQYILIKMAVGQGPDRLSSVTALKYILASSPLPTAPLKAIVEPCPMLMIMLHSIEPMEGVVTFGYDADYPRGKDFNYATLLQSNLGPTDSIVIVPEAPGFNGEAVQFYFSVADFLSRFEPLLDSIVYTYYVYGEFFDGEWFLFDASVTIHGHRSGDLNLDGQVDISDLVYMVDFFFMGGPAPQLIQTADLDGNGTVDISDLMLLIEQMFLTN